MDDDMDYGFEYSDDDEDDTDVDVENAYYNAKASKEESEWSEALSGFESVVDMEGDAKGEWGFKALRNIVKINHRLGNSPESLAAYRRLLEYISGAVTRNYAEKVVNSVLDFVSVTPAGQLVHTTTTTTPAPAAAAAAASTPPVGTTIQDGGGSGSFLKSFYELTLEALKQPNAHNERLWFKTNLKLCELWFTQREFGRMARTLKELHKACRLEDGTEDHKKGTQLLEVFAVEIKMHTERKDHKKLKELYRRALTVKSAIPHPRIMGIIRECGGKMHMDERSWDMAATDFFEAFKSYDEAGERRRISCLKYLVLASMLMESKVDPFDAQEAKPYKHDPEIVAMTNLVEAYGQNDIAQFERVLRGRDGETILGDAFIRDYVEDLLRNVRTSVVLRLVQPYTSLTLAFLADELNVSVAAVEELVVDLILDGRLVGGELDQVTGVLSFKKAPIAVTAAGAGAADDPRAAAAAAAASSADAKYAALDRWAKQLLKLLASQSKGL